MSELNGSGNGKINRSESIAELAMALSKAQGEIKGALKDSSNPFFKSKYADLSSVWEACRVPLTKNAIAVIQCPRTNSEGIEVETIMAHSSGQWISETLTIPVPKRDAQALGSAITYARRYALASFVGVAPEEDDGNAAVQSPKSKVQSLDVPAANEPFGPGVFDGPTEPPSIPASAHVKSPKKSTSKLVREAQNLPTQENQFSNAYHFEIAQKMEQCNELMSLPCFDADRERDEFKKFYAKVNRTDHTLESITKALKVLNDQAEIRFKAQKKADKDAGLEVREEDLPLLNNIESSTEAF